MWLPRLFLLLVAILLASLAILPACAFPTECSDELASEKLDMPAAVLYNNSMTKLEHDHDLGWVLHFSENFGYGLHPNGTNVLPAYDDSIRKRDDPSSPNSEAFGFDQETLDKITRVARTLPSFEEIDGDNGAEDDRAMTLDEETLFFEFNEFNIEESRVKDWFMAWTITKPHHPKFANHTELAAFTGQFLHSLNVDCNFWEHSCTGMITQQEIQRLYPGPGNRTRARRIFFLTMMLINKTRHHSMKLDMSKLAHDKIQPEILELVRRSTKQLDSNNLRRCTIIKALIGAAQDAAINLAFNAVGGFISPFGAIGGPLENIAKFNKEVNGLGEKLGEGRYKNFNTTLGFDMSMMVVGAITSIIPRVGMAAWQRVGDPAAILDSTGRSDNLHLTSSISLDPICATFEGDIQDDNAANADIIRRFFEQTMERTRSLVHDDFKMLMEGYYPVAEGPSMTAMIFYTTDWAGDNGNAETSIMYQLDHSYEWYNKHIEKMVKAIISSIAAKGHSYMACTNSIQAQDTCAEIAESSPNHVPWIKSIICPDPVNKPTEICQASYWHIAETGSHQSEMPLLSSFNDSYWKDNFNLIITPAQALNESYTYYNKHGNDFSDLNAENLWEYSQDSLFHLPICWHETNMIANYNFMSGRPGWFPSVCGDFRGSETAAFMKAIDLGPESALYAQGVENSNKKQPLITDKRPNELYYDRIPRNLARVSDPYSRYMALCELGLRWPQDQDQGKYQLIDMWRLKMGKDDRCEMVAEATASMSQDEARRWFCSKETRDQHGVFKHEKDFIDLKEESGLWRQGNHGKWCDAQIKDNYPALPVIEQRRSIFGLWKFLTQQERNKWNLEAIKKADFENGIDYTLGSFTRVWSGLVASFITPWMIPVAIVEGLKTGTDGMTLGLADAPKASVFQNGATNATEPLPATLNSTATPVLDPPGAAASTPASQSVGDVIDASSSTDEPVLLYTNGASESDGTESSGSDIDKVDDGPDKLL